MAILQTGNTFDKQTFKQGHSRKVWREIRRQWPAGVKVTNVSDWVNAGKIPAGTPCKYGENASTKAKEVKCYTDAQVKAAVTKQGASEAPGIDSLGINGYTDRDIIIASANTAATATAIREGDIYEYMFDADVATALKANSKCLGVTFVN